MHWKSILNFLEILDRTLNKIESTIAIGSPKCMQQVVANYYNYSQVEGVG